jgi:hypothetical protein
MDTMLAMLDRGVNALLGRASGPLNFRLVVMPTVVSILAIRAGLRDAREGRPVFLWAFITDASERPRLLRSALKDVGRIFIVALVLDTTYQLLVLRWVYPGQLLIVAVACAIVPYIVIRGPTTRLLRAVRRRLPERAHGMPDHATQHRNERAHQHRENPRGAPAALGKTRARH